MTLLTKRIVPPNQGVLITEASAFGYKQMLNGEYEKAALNFDLALETAKSSVDMAPSVIAVVYAKAAMNQTNYDEKQADKSFALAVANFESSTERDEVAFGECLSQFGRFLQSRKKLKESIDMYEKALKAYSNVTQESPEMAQRMQLLRYWIEEPPELARGAKREELRKRVASILNSPTPLETPSLKDALKIMHELGLEQELTLKEAKKLAPDEDGDDDGGWRLLEALRSRYEKAIKAGQTPTNGIIVYPMQFGKEDVQDCFDFFCKWTGKQSWFRAITAGDLFDPITIETGDSKSITIDSYRHVSDIVGLVNKRLEQEGDERRFYDLEGAEDEGVYYLLPIETQKRLEEKGALQFAVDSLLGFS